MVSLRFASAIAALSTFRGVVNAATTLPVPNPANGDVNGEYCGPSFENKKCSAGWCCSVDGICGKGGYYCSGPDCQFKFADACDANQKPGGADTANTPRTKFGSVPYGVTLTTCTKPGVVALTFDDGPYLYTNQLLDYLSSQKVNVTFFMTANNGGKGDIGQPSSPYYATVKRAFDDGHQIASHTYSHQDLSLIGADYRKKQVQYNEIVFNSILGMIPTYIRPPYLSCDADCLKDLGDWGYHVLSIDLDTNDWQLNYPQAKKDFLELGVNYSPCEKSWNTLAHDIHQQTVTDLVPFMIENLHARGYRTALIGECLGDAPENWYRHPTTGAPAGPSRNLPAYVAPTNCTAVVAPEPECGPIGPKSTNGQCGAAAGGAICNNGECCSQWGWCGATTDNCDAGCQVAFGACNGIAPICRNNTSASASLSATRAPSATVSSFASASVSVSRLSSASGSASRVSSAVSSAASGSASRASSAASGSASRVSSASAGSSAAASGSASRGSSAAASGSAAPSGSVSRGSSAAPSGSASRGSSAAASASGRPSGSSGAASASARPSGSSAAASASGRPSGSSVRPSGASVRPSGSSVAASARPSGSSAAGSASARPSGSSARASGSAAPSGSSVRPSSIRASSVRASASPSASAGAISKDGTCGPSHGNTSCPNGQCCSQYGWCGVSTAFCGTGCLSKFGVCSGGRDTQNEWTDPSKLKESQDGVCGGASGLKCPTGQCCSQYGWCGRGSDFCRSGCQRAFGQCS